MSKTNETEWTFGEPIESPSVKYYETKETSEPVAEEIVSVLINSKKSYLECLQALEIAKDKLLLTYPSK